MTLRDHRNKAKQWSYGRAQLSERAAGAHYGKRRTRLTEARVKAAQQQLKGANDAEREREGAYNRDDHG